jgi:Ca2+-binding RTX toxin-like protein
MFRNLFSRSRKNQPVAKKPGFRPTMEQLEGRQLMNAAMGISVLVASTPGHLGVLGTDGDDQILVAPAPGRKLQVTNLATGAKSEPVSIDKVNTIIVDGLGGNDTIVVDAKVTVPASITGGEGEDTLVGGSGDDKIIGGIGNDVLRGGFGQDELFGDFENLSEYEPIDSTYFPQMKDQLFGEGGVDYLNGGWGADFLDGGSRYGNTIARDKMQGLDLHAYEWDSGITSVGEVAKRSEHGKASHFTAILAGLAQTRNLGIWIEYKGDGDYGVRLYSRTQPGTLEEVIVHFDGKGTRADPARVETSQGVDFWPVLFFRAFLKQRGVDPGDEKWFERPLTDARNVYESLTGRNATIPSAPAQDLPMLLRAPIKPVMVFVNNALAAPLQPQRYYAVIGAPKAVAFAKKGHPTDWMIKLHNPADPFKPVEVRWSKLQKALGGNRVVVGELPLHADGTFGQLNRKPPVTPADSGPVLHSPFKLQVRRINYRGEVTADPVPVLERYGEKRLEGRFAELPGQRGDTDLLYEMSLLPFGVKFNEGTNTFKIKEVLVGGKAINLQTDVVDGWFQIKPDPKGGTVEVVIKEEAVKLAPVPSGAWTRVSVWNDLSNPVRTTETLTISVTGGIASGLLVTTSSSPLGGTTFDSAPLWGTYEEVSGHVKLYRHVSGPVWDPGNTTVVDYGTFYVDGGQLLNVGTGRPWVF